MSALCVKRLSLFLFCWLVVVVACEGSAGKCVRVGGSVAGNYLADHVRRHGVLCQPSIKMMADAFSHTRGSRFCDSSTPRPVCAAEGGIGSPGRSCRRNSRVLNPAFLTATPDYVSEASLAGAWELLFYPSGSWEEVNALISGFDKKAAGEESGCLAALQELYTPPPRSWWSLDTVFPEFAPRSHPTIYVKLQPDRLGIPADTRLPPVVWQLKRRLYSSLYIELEMAFLPGNPQFMLVFEAPVSPGKHFPQAINVHKGTVSLAFAPFLPWQKRKIGEFTMTPKTLLTIVDPVHL